ncbi:sugar kinase [Alteribacillus sp. HJP-4]|uniref:sugar kinase n=1 Tax=Alteribacillus sp. HJP-4 TaxID=2775394 RepID=UPI0035CD134B
MDVITMGETMALFSPEQNGMMRYAHMYSRKFGGAESNFAIGLTRLGHQTGWISRVGNDELGKAMLQFVRGEGVNVDNVKLEDKAPTGLYFKEFRREGEIRVQYYRKGSAASLMNEEDADEAYIKKARYLHITGITPALSTTCRQAVLKAIQVARSHGVTIVFDPNLRKSLWSEEEARTTLLEISALADIVLPGIAEGEFLFGTEDPEELGRLFLEKGAKEVVLKAGEKGTYYYSKNDSMFVPAFQVANVIDPVGAGDGFAAGYVSGLLDELSVNDAILRGNAVGALVTQVNGDVEGLPEKEEVMRFMSSEGEDVTR